MTTLNDRAACGINEDENIENLPAISNRLNQMGYLLRPYAPKDDEESFYQIFREIVESGNQFPYDCSSKNEFLQQFIPPQGKVYICQSLNGEIVGGFHFKANYSGKAKHIANAGYMIQSSYRAKGIGSLLIKASLHLAKNDGFQAMQFNMVLSQNIPAVKLYQKLGFTIVGTIPEAVLNPNGSYQNSYVMYRKL